VVERSETRRGLLKLLLRKMMPEPHFTHHKSLL